MVEIESPPRQFNLSQVKCVNLSKCSDPINTGIGFFDHMLDQLNSHAQVGISVTVDCNDKSSGVATDFSDHNRYAEPIQDQEEIVRTVGRSVGLELQSLFPENSIMRTKSSRFCCPLDEALVECIITQKLNEFGEAMPGKLSEFSLAPYGIFPEGGRTKIGSWGTAYVQSFFEALASSMQVDISLVKIRGQNGHHVVESAFKAFSRALRNFLDGVDIDSLDFYCGEDTGDEKKEHDHVISQLWGINSQSSLIGNEMMRQGIIERSTKETSIFVEAKLFPPESADQDSVLINTGIPMVDTIFKEIASQTGMQLIATCNGDLHIDDHHSAEDVAIAFGKVLNKALGTKAGLNRMWLGRATVRDCEVEVTMDLSNRPCLTSDLPLETLGPNQEIVNGLSIEMVDHVFDSIVMNGQMTVHIVEKASKSGPRAVEDLIVATARAFGRALKMCTAVDPRRNGATASSKGTLSV